MNPIDPIERLHAVLLAGGRGTRFWPRSRSARPKQFLDITGEGSMLRLTWERVVPLVPAARILVLTSGGQAPLVRAQLPELPEGNLVAEPVGRNTAPCVGLAARLLLGRSRDAVMAVLPADHRVGRPERFRGALAEAARVAEERDALVTFGIRPTRPETGYGYIRKGPEVERGEVPVHRVSAFIEKPDPERARALVESGEVLWNSGMFVWKADVILSEIERFLPETARGLERIGEALGTDSFSSVLAETYPALESISVDYGVMERSDRVVVAEVDLEWNDLGSWNSLAEIHPRDEAGNVVVGRVVAVDAAGNIVHASGRTVALVGVDDLVVVEEDDALLVTRRERVQDVRRVIEILEEQGRDDLL
jgi:mannose-1-phosphate guanylyltransferase